MKNKIKGFICGFLVTFFLMTGIVYAAGITATIEVVLNNVNVAINNEIFGVEDANYVLANGDEVPFSILYKGTTYLPIRKVAEFLGKEVTWDGNTRTAGIVDSIATETIVDTSTNSRTNPAGIGEKLVLECEDFFNGEYTVEMTLTKIVRGQVAENIILDANMFNSKSGSDKEYVLAKFKIKIVETEKDESVDINHANFEAVSANGVLYDDFVVVSNVEPDISSEYYSGSEYEGYTYFLIDDGDSAVARYECKYSEYAWFRLY